MRRFPLSRCVGLLAVLVASSRCSEDPTGPGGAGPGNPAGAKAATVIVSPADARLSIGQTTTLTAEVRDSTDAVIEDAVVTWSSSDADVATVDATGLVTAIGEGSARVTARSGPASGDATLAVEVVSVCACAVIIDSTNLSLVSRDSISGRFEFRLIEGEMPEIDTTSVIVGAQDEGFLRHVDGVERSGNTLVMQTSQAGLANVIENGGFGGSTQIFAEGDAASAQLGVGGQGRPNVVWGKTEVVQIADGLQQVSPGVLKLSGLKLSPKADQGGDSSLPADFEFAVEDGALNFGPTLDLGAEIGGGTLQRFHAIYTGGLSLTAFSDEAEPLVWSVGISKKITLAEAKQTLVTLRKPFIYWAGYVPITGVLLFTITAKAEATASGAIKYKGDFGAGFSLTGGVRYDAGNWSSVFGTTTRWDGAPPPPLEGLGAEVEAKVSFTVQPELFLKFYYVAGPFVNVQPTLEAPAQLGLPGFDWFARVDYVTKLGLGGRAEILRKQPKGKFKGWTEDDLLKLEFGATIPLHRPLILAEIYSRGPLVVTDMTAGDDLDDFYDVELTPAFNVNDALFGLKHAASTQTIPDSPPGTHRVFTDVRSGESHAHRVRLTDLAGNCTVQSAVYDTVGVRSDLRIVTPGIVDHDTSRVAFDVNCIPLGAVQVTTATSGPDPDPDGYQLVLTRVDTVGTSRKWFDGAEGGAGNGGGAGAWVAETSGPAVLAASVSGAQITEGPAIDVAGAALIDSLIPRNPDPRSRATGEHEFALEGVRENCAVASPASHDAVVLSGDTLRTNFEVRCVELGNVMVGTRTDDADPPPASEPIGYSARVLRVGAAEDSVRVQLAATDDTTITGRIPLYTASGATGEHLVELSVADLPDRCAADGPATRTVTVLSGETAAVEFDVTCVERLHVRTRTTGAGMDPNGYQVVVEPAAAPSDTLLRSIGSNATLAITGTRAGTNTLRLEGIADGCSAAAGAIDVDVSARDSTLVTFDVACPVAAVRDSVVYPVAPLYVNLKPEHREVVLGTFEVPPHVADYGVEVSVDVERTAAQPDEAFAIGASTIAGPMFISPIACPVIPDDGVTSQTWVVVGTAPLPNGDQEFIARHGVEFDCYELEGNLDGGGSVHFFALKLVYWRNP